MRSTNSRSFSFVKPPGMRSADGRLLENGEFGGVGDDGGLLLLLLFVDSSISLAFVFKFIVSINRRAFSKLDSSKTDAGVTMEAGPEVKETGMVVPVTVGRTKRGSVATAGTRTVVEGVLFWKQKRSSSSSSSLSSS